MSELQPFIDRLSALINNLSPQARKQIATAVARKLRVSQQQNIKRQQAPDGTPFKPRKTQPIRKKKGRIRREMFAKLRTAKYMKAKGTANDATVEFAGRVQRMARVHHYGLRDRPVRGAEDVQYEARPLLGFNENDIQKVQEIIIQKLASSN
ncbi:phage virion morphogenesis protein [Erwinia toletana]|uniref:Phage virion morphogenesis protein n=1 Tax=Winslowiella toletana TaxID=92490 RepID=A0ABS4P4X7_9GAMM|nr:phage virion morphogenesis protein [Winslowiella toletana]MBP2167008.1 phage virion morphogenesis protein [Winslowiella toletana]